jgi:hypothetical protein
VEMSHAKFVLDDRQIFIYCAVHGRDEASRAPTTRWPAVGTFKAPTLTTAALGPSGRARILNEACHSSPMKVDISQGVAASLKSEAAVFSRHSRPVNGAIEPELTPATIHGANARVGAVTANGEGTGRALAAARPDQTWTR